MDMHSFQTTFLSQREITGLQSPGPFQRLMARTDPGGLQNSVASLVGNSPTRHKPCCSTSALLAAGAVLCYRAALCLRGQLATSLVPVPPFPYLPQSWQPKNASWNCQISVGSRKGSKITQTLKLPSNRTMILIRCSIVWSILRILFFRKMPLVKCTKHYSRTQRDLTRTLRDIWGIDFRGHLMT